MQMNDIIDGLGSCEYAPVGQGCGNNIGNCGGFGNCGGGFGNCGFGWWIWILLILFYSNQGNSGYAGNNCGCCNCGCSNDCCGNGGYGGIFNGGGTSCGTWLFLLVILFLCGGCNNNGFGSGCGFGNGFGFGGDCLGLGQGCDGLFGGCC